MKRLIRFFLLDYAFFRNTNLKLFKFLLLVTIVFVFLQSQSCRSLEGWLMTEHLDGSYPTSKFSGKSKPWVMDR